MGKMWRNWECLNFKNSVTKIDWHLKRGPSGCELLYQCIPHHSGYFPFKFYFPIFMSFSFSFGHNDTSFQRGPGLMAPQTYGPRLMAPLSLAWWHPLVSLMAPSSWLYGTMGFADKTKSIIKFPILKHWCIPKYFQIIKEWGCWVGIQRDPTPFSFSFVFFNFSYRSTSTLYFRCSTEILPDYWGTFCAQCPFFFISGISIILKGQAN